MAATGAVRIATWAVCLVCCFADVLRYGFPSDIKKDEVGNHWAVIVAGSSGWYNYRHQADACHAYHVLRNHGFEEDHIITLMYDDIAYNEKNPTPGIVINHPNGSDVYAGVKIDYRKEDVTPSVFLAVLQGDSDTVQGKGTGRVLKSGPKDHVFVNFVDHGGPGILGFPTTMLKSTQLLSAIKYMYNNDLYKQMVFYVEACESGSIFKGLLPNSINVYVTTAANSKESSYACYMDKKRDTYLGDVYSVNWMEDSDKEDLRKESLHKQYKIVKSETNTSHVMQYGNKTLAYEDVSEFQGGETYIAPPAIVLPKVPLDAVPSEDVPLAILKYRLKQATSDSDKQLLTDHLNWLNQVRSRVDSLMKYIVQAATTDQQQTERVFSSRLELQQRTCYESAVDAFDESCVRLAQNDYALRRLYLLVNLCEEGIAMETIVSSIRQVCSGIPYY